jgi:hypothetical protein
LGSPEARDEEAGRALEQIERRPLLLDPPVAHEHDRSARVIASI